MSKTFLALFRCKNGLASFLYLLRCAVRGRLIANYRMIVFHWILSKGQNRVTKGSEEWMPYFFSADKIREDAQSKTTSAKPSSQQKRTTHSYWNEKSLWKLLALMEDSYQENYSELKTFTEGNQNTLSDEAPPTVCEL